ncbi:MAG: right-handed parallel beta-helix repeat-containing protein [Phycisphaerales bacterium]|nr:right-handed parallel beta-helix repeat-containing protein [Phycisphaerales bacterium]
MLTLLAAVLRISMALPGQATYYVDVNHPNASDENPGTEDQPFRTIQRAADIVSPGDTTNIKPGVYTRPQGRNRVVEIQRGGTETAPITFAGIGEGEVLLDNGFAGDWALYVNARFQPVDHVVIRGFTMTGGLSGGVYVRNSNGTVVERCRAVDNRGIGIFIGAGGAHQTVQRCEVARNYNGLKVGDNSEGSQPRRVTVQHNHCHDNANPDQPGNSDGIQCLGDGNVYSIVRGNVVHDNSDDGIDVGQGAEFTLIERNVVYNHVDPDGDGSGIKIGTHESYLPPGGGQLVRYNVLFNNKLRHFDLAGNYRVDERGKRPAPMILHNNTCYQSGGDVIYAESMDVILFNNIAHAPDNAPYWSCRLRGAAEEPPLAWSDFNLWGNRWIKDWDESLRTDLDAHTVEGDPQFNDTGNIAVNTDLASPDFGRVVSLDLRETSPAYGLGLDPFELIEKSLKKAPSDRRNEWKDAVRFALENTTRRVNSGAFPYP